MDTLNDIAAKHGFQSVEHLRKESQRLGKHDGDERQSYLAHSPLGYWFVWDDPPGDASANSQSD